MCDSVCLAPFVRHNFNSSVIIIINIIISTTSNILEWVRVAVSIEILFQLNPFTTMEKTTYFVKL